MQDELFPPGEHGPPPSHQLTGEQRARLHALPAGGRNEIAACERVGDPKLRALLVNFFCLLCAHECRQLRQLVALLEWFRRRGHPRRCGADILSNTAKAVFLGFECDNDVRCFYSRAVAIVRPDFGRAGMLDMTDDGQANVLLSIGWQPSVPVDWLAIPPALADVTLP